MIDIIREKLSSYATATVTDEDHALKEILQEIALHALWRVDFFDIALFQGGTSLRILHKLPRFSEDLDFILRKPDLDFDLQPYLRSLRAVFDQFGLALEVVSKDRMDSVIREAILKDTAIARQLDLSFTTGHRPVIKIKLEIDTNPPLGSGEATSYLDFPMDYQVRHQDLPSNFALKIHALLCRGYLKGRDWYDFSWYVTKGVFPHLPLLENALRQKGPWHGQPDLHTDAGWLNKVLETKIEDIDWPAAAADVRRFLRPSEHKSLDLWCANFFHNKRKKLFGIVG